MTLPGQVATQLMEMKSTYGVFAAWDASEIAMLLLAEKNVTPKQSQKDDSPIVTMDDFTIEQTHYNAKASQGILYAELRMFGSPDKGYTITNHLKKTSEGVLGKKQTEQGKPLLALLEQKVHDALQAAGWRVVGTSTGGKDIWKKRESE